jgi:hypothetical protein
MHPGRVPRLMSRSRPSSQPLSLASCVRPFRFGSFTVLPFLVLDLVISSLLVSMGMMMLPQALISLPFKLMLFVLVDGWNLIIGSLGAELLLKWERISYDPEFFVDLVTRALHTAIPPGHTPAAGWSSWLGSPSASFRRLPRCKNRPCARPQDSGRCPRLVAVSPLDAASALTFSTTLFTHFPDYVR